MVWTLWIATVLVWLGAAYYLRGALKPDRSTTMVHYWLSLLFISFALTFILPPVYRLVYEVSGVPNLGRLLANSAAVLAIWSCQNAVYPGLLSAHVSARLRRLATALTVVALLIMAALFFAAGPLPESREGWVSYYSIGPIAAYRLTYQGYLLLSLLALTMLWARFAVVSVGTRLKTGFGLMAAGGVFGLGYLLNDVGTVTAAIGWRPFAWWGNTGVSDLFITLAISLVLAGVTMPAWLRVVQAVRAHVAFLRLRGLWLELRAACPRVALLPERPLWRDVIDPREASFRLHRQVVEIRDACLLLGPRADPSARQLAREIAIALGLGQRGTASLEEAAFLWAALRRHGQESYRRARAVSNDATSLQLPSHSGTLWKEVSHLVQVKRHLAGTWPMRQVQQRLERPMEAGPTLSASKG